MNLDTNKHSVFLLNYHLIMCIKYRNKVIDNSISSRLKEIFEYIAPNYHVELEEWNHELDHVHILFRGQPNLLMHINPQVVALLKKNFL